MKVSNFKKDTESKDYKGCSYEVENVFSIERTAKVTPKKTGLFVTCWKRNSNGVTEPFDSSDEIDFLIINTKEANHSGQFVFPKAALILHGILSTHKKGGKRGFRVYPTWSNPTSKQAIKTQLWQLDYFS